MLPPALHLQQTIADRLTVDEVLSAYDVTMEADGVTEADVKAALGPYRAGGKAGAAPGQQIIVQITEDRPDDRPNIPGPQETLRATVRILEIPKLARAAGDAYRPFDAIAQRIKRLLHQCQLGTAPILYVGASGYNDGAGTVGKDVEFSWRPAPDLGAVQIARPTITRRDDGTLLIASGTPGATVAVTADGSYPAPDSPGIPDLAPPSGTLIRAVAYKAGLIASGVTESLIP